MVTASTRRWQERNRLEAEKRIKEQATKPVQDIEAERQRLSSRAGEIRDYISKNPTAQSDIRILKEELQAIETRQNIIREAASTQEAQQRVSEYEKQPLREYASSNAVVGGGKLGGTGAGGATVVSTSEFEDREREKEYTKSKGYTEDAKLDPRSRVLEPTETGGIYDTRTQAKPSERYKKAVKEAQAAATTRTTIGLTENIDTQPQTRTAYTIGLQETLDIWATAPQGVAIDEPVRRSNKEQIAEIKSFLRQAEAQGIQTITIRTPEGIIEVPIGRAYREIIKAKNITSIGVIPTIPSGYTLAGSLSEPVLFPVSKSIVQDPFGRVSEVEGAPIQPQPRKPDLIEAELKRVTGLKKPSDPFTQQVSKPFYSELLGGAAGLVQLETLGAKAIKPEEPIQMISVPQLTAATEYTSGLIGAGEKAIERGNIKYFVSGTGEAGKKAYELAQKQGVVATIAGGFGFIFPVGVGVAAKIASITGKGIKAAPKAVASLLVKKTPKQVLEEQKVFYRPTNIFREPVPVDIFKKDTASTLTKERVPLGETAATGVVTKTKQPVRTLDITPTKEIETVTAKPKAATVETEYGFIPEKPSTTVFEKDVKLTEFTEQPAPLGVGETKIVAPSAKFAQTLVNLGVSPGAIRIRSVSLGAGTTTGPPPAVKLGKPPVREDPFYRTDLPKTRAQEKGTYRIQQEKIFESDKTLAGFTETRTPLGAGLTKEIAPKITLEKRAVGLGESQGKIVDKLTGLERKEVRLGDALVKTPERKVEPKLVREDPFYRTDLPKTRAQEKGTYRIQQEKIFESDKTLAGFEGSQTKLGKGIGRIRGYIGLGKFKASTITERGKGFIISTKTGEKGVRRFKRTPVQLEDKPRRGAATILEKPAPTKGFTETKVELGKAEKAGLVTTGSAVGVAAPTVGIPAPAVGETIGSLTGGNSTDPIPEPEIDIMPSPIEPKSTSEKRPVMVAAITRGAGTTGLGVGLPQRVSERIKSTTATRSQIIQRTKPKQIQLSRAKTIQIYKPVPTFKIRQSQKQKELFKYKTPSPQPKLPKLAQPFKFKQPEALRLKMPEPLKPEPPRVRAALPFFPRKERKSKRIKEAEKAERATFLGNVPVSDILGVHKRPDIIYGESKTGKLAMKDLLGSSKGRFSTAKTLKLLGKEKRYFTPTKKESKRMLRL